MSARRSRATHGLLSEHRSPSGNSQERHMLGNLAALVIRRRVTFLAAVGVFIVLAGALGGNVAKHLSNGGFNDPGSPSEQAQQELRRVFHADNPNLILLVTAKNGTV